MDFAHLFEPLAAEGPLVYFCYHPADRRVLHVTPNYARELGGRAAAVNDELRGWWEALHPDDRRYLAQGVDQALGGGPAKELLLRFARPDGGTRWLSLTATTAPAEAGTGPLLSGYVQDVTATQAVLANAQRYQAKKDSMLEILSRPGQPPGAG